MGGSGLLQCCYGEIHFYTSLVTDEGKVFWPKGGVELGKHLYDIIIIIACKHTFPL